MAKQIGYARVSTKAQITDRQQTDLLAAGVRHDDLYIDHGVSGARASRPQLDAAIDALQDGDTLVVTTLDRLGRSTANLLALPTELKQRGAALRVLNLGGRKLQFTPSQIQNAQRLIDAGEPATQVAKDMGMSRATLYRRIATTNTV